jgi:hypothetical protein
MSHDTIRTSSAPFNWRDHLKVHPAADLFPLMSETELKELAEDIKQNGLKNPIVLATTSLLDESGNRTDVYTHALLDGRNRLDALALLGWLEPAEKPKKSLKRGVSTTRWYAPIKLICDDVVNINDDAIFNFEDGDFGDDCLYSTSASLNLHRRHLTPSQKRDLIAKQLKRDPEVSDRQIGDTVSADHKTVGDVRAELERRGEIPHVKKRKDTKGRKQPSSKPKSDDLLQRLYDDQEAWLAANPGKTLSDGFWLTDTRTEEERAAGLPPRVKSDLEIVDRLKRQDDAIKQALK